MRPYDNPPMESYLIHHGILGQKWGVRRFQNLDGSLTVAGRNRYLGWGGKLNKKGMAARDSAEKAVKEAVGKSDLSSIEKKSKEFQDLGESLTHDYEEYCKSMQNDQDFKKKVWANLREEFGDGADDEEFFDIVVDDVVSDVLKNQMPKDLQEKTKNFYKAGDEYFDQIKSLSEKIEQEVGLDNELNQAMYVRDGKNYVDDFVRNDSRLDVALNAYMYKNIPDMAFQDNDYLYALENQFSMREYNRMQG